MIFTDDDLRRCKRLLAGEMSMQKHVLNNPEVEALLARLEAAEELASIKEHPLHTFPTETGDQCPIAIAEDKWRKSKGDVSDSDTARE